MRKTILSAVVALTLLGTEAQANSTKLTEQELDKKIITFSTNLIKKWESKGLKIKKVSILNKAPVIGSESFKGYVLQFDTDFVMSGKTTPKILTDIFFVSDEGVVATSIFSLEGENLSQKTKFNLSKDQYYNDEHFAMGNKDAETKVLVFSDVFCPFCRKMFPKFAEEVNKNKDNVAVYFIDFPLEELHPASRITSEIIKQAERKGRKDVRGKLYTIDLSPISKTSNIKTISDFIENKTGFKADLSAIEIDDKAVSKDIDLARRLAVEKTPSMLIDGQHSSFAKLKKILSEKKSGK